MSEDVRLEALHQVHVVLSQFEGCPLETHVAWGTRKHETKVDMDDMPVCINQDVLVVPILNLEQVLHQRVPG